jgi:sugar phosphate permease
MPITIYTMQIMHITNLQVYFLGLVFMISYPFAYYFANYALDQKGLKFGLHIGTILTLIGALIRCLGYYSYAPLIGQILASIGEPFLLDGPSKLVNEWFSPNVRSFFITIAGSANNIGISLGFLIPSAFLKPGNINKISLLYALIVEAGIVLVVSIMQFILFRPSPFKEINKNTMLFYCKPYAKLCRNKNFILILIAGSLGTANFQTFSTVIEGLIVPFGFTSHHSSILGFILLFGGVTESVLLGIVTNKTKKYKLIFLICTAICLAILIALYFVLAFHRLSLVILCILLISPGTVFILPLSLDYVQLLSPDVGESTSSGAVLSLAQIISIVQITICDKIQTTFKGTRSSIYMIYVMGVASVISLVLPLFLKSSTALTISPTKSNDKSTEDLFSPGRMTIDQ